MSAELGFIDRHRMAMPSAEEALSWYRPLVEQTEQAQPMLLVGSLRGTVGLSLSSWARVGDGVLYGATLARSSGYYPMWLVASVEAWRRSYPNEATAIEAADRLRHGDMEKAAELGDERVREVVSVTARNRVGGGYLAVAEFKRTQHGVVWESPEIFPLDSPEIELIAGEVMTAMTVVLTSDPG